MLIDGLNLNEGSVISNLTVSSGTAFPSNPAAGELFFRTDLNALHVYNNSTWVKTVDSSTTDVAWSAITGEPTTLAGYGITDAVASNAAITAGTYTSVTVDTKGLVTAGTNPTTLAGYGITDAAPLSHTSDATVHLTSAQNTWIDAITATSAEVNYLSGVTSAIQTQLNGKQATVTGAATTVVSSNLTSNSVMVTDVNGKISVNTLVSNNELNYLDGVTSSIQTQLDSKASATSLSNHSSDQTLHLTSGQNTWIDAITATSGDVNLLAGAAAGGLSAAEIMYVNGVTSAIQTQLDDKLSKSAGGTMSGNIVVSTGYHVTLTDAPSNGTDAVNKTYVDNNLAGLTWKNSVKAASTANLTLSGTQTVDGIALVAGDRVLVKDQSTASQNGVYVVAAGAWTRSTDMDQSTPLNEFNSAAVFVEQGSTQADTGWTQINNVSTIGTDAVAFTQFNGAAGITAGTGLIKTGNTLDVNLGAGIAQLPTDEVGIDLYTGGGLMLTVDGTATSTANTSQLSLTKTGVSANTYKSVTVDVYGRVTAGSTTVTADAVAGTSITGTTLASNVVTSSLTSVGTITTGTWSGLFGSVSGANLTSLTADNLSGTIPSAVLGNSTLYVGTSAVTLNRASANQALTGISSVALPGATSGTITITPSAVAGTTAITVPATTGTLVTTGDTGTVTNTMLAGSIANAKLTNSSVTVGTTAISLGASSTTLAGLTSVTSTSFVGALTGNAVTATTATNANNVALVDAANVAAAHYLVFADAATGNQALQTDAGITYNPSTNVLTTTASSAQYADLAENYVADSAYRPGTVVDFGGAYEVTVSVVDGSRKVAGVVSTNPAYLMNEKCAGEHVVAVAFQGRVPCMVTGNVEKGDMLVSNGDGTARAEADPKVGQVIGKALENFTGTTGVIEVVVGRD